MYFAENPVLQRELLVNLRMKRGFVLLFLYQAVLAAVVYFAWPQDTRLDLTESNKDARKLVDMFFLGQYLLVSLMTPSFAAGSITGEKERKTYEMLLASPLRPAAIVIGKMVASLTHLAVLMFSSLPIVMLCLPLGGVSPYEVLAAYLGMTVSVVTFGAISVWCSSYFSRTAASLVVSYLLILPLALTGVLAWFWMSQFGELRLLLTITVLPAVGLTLSVLLMIITSLRLLHPPDVGAEGKDVIDLEQEAQTAVGLVIQPDQFPDRLFAARKRNDLMEDGTNPVYDKELRSEIFSQGTLMLRLVIQVSMLLAIPLMAYCLYIEPSQAPWYMSYVLLFNILVGPVFSAGSITSERERQTLDLLLTTAVTPWQILWGKLIAGLRISSVLTMFLLWPVLLAYIMVDDYWPNLACILAYVAIVLASCATTAMIALVCSAAFRKTATSLMTSYLLILLLYGAPVAVQFFATEFYPVHSVTQSVKWIGALSPFSATFSVPLVTETRASSNIDLPVLDWWLVAAYTGASLILLSFLAAAMVKLFHSRWRVAVS